MQTAEKLAPKAESAQKPSDARIGHKTLESFKFINFNHLSENEHKEISTRIINSVEKLNDQAINSKDKDRTRRLYKKSDALISSLPKAIPKDEKNLIELLDFSSQKTPPNYLVSDSIARKIAQSANVSKGNKINDILSECPPVERLKMMTSIYKLSGYYTRSEQGQQKILANICSAFENQAQSEQSPPLVRIIANDYLEQTKINLIEGDHPYDFTRYLNPKQLKMIEDRRADSDKLITSLKSLRKKYPYYSKYELIKEISPDFTAGLAELQLSSIVAKDGSRSFTFAKPNSQTNQMHLSPHSQQLLQLCHGSNTVSRKISETLNYKIEKIPLESQLALLNFMSKADNKRFNKLCDTMKNIDENLKPKLLENFVATGFGDDFGDSLLTLANSKRFSKEQIGEIFDNFTSCRNSINSITRLYAKIDNGQFAKEYRLAASERLTDAVAVFREIAQKGSATTDLTWIGKPKFKINSAMEALRYETKSLEIISGTMSDVMNGKEGTFAEVVLPPDHKNSYKARTMYNFYSPKHGYVLLHTRAEGSHVFDPMVEYGKKVRNPNSAYSNSAGTEASISFMADPVSPFALPSPFRPDQKKLQDPSYYNKENMNRVSAIRLDREGRTPDQNPDSDKKDPINKSGTVSVDLAAIGDRSDTPSGKIARLFSVGNKLRNEKISNNDNSSLNHNTNWFEQKKYGNADYFKSIVNQIDASMLELCKTRPPEPSQQSFKKAFNNPRKK